MRGVIGASLNTPFIDGQEELADDASRLTAELIERYKCTQHPMKVCYLKRGQHQTLAPIQTKAWVDQIVSILSRLTMGGVLQGKGGLMKRFIGVDTMQG